MKKLVMTFITVVAVVSIMAFNVTAQVTPTPFFTSFADSTISTTYNGQPVIIGSIIKAFDPDGILCGMDTVHTTGTYGFMPVYGDDPNSAGVDEGATSGQTITFHINGRLASVDFGDPTWTDQAIKTASLSASAVHAISAVNLPTSEPALPGDTIQFKVDVRNDGNGTDFYGVNLSMSIAGGPSQFEWEALEPDTAVYADSGQIVSVFFSIKVPTFNADTVNTITYTVFSHLDPTANISSTVDVYMTLTDVDDRPDNLPAGFALNQNYPNPFNPGTTIGFSVPVRTQAHIDIINVLGQQVDRIDLGVIPSGDHEIEYDASNLSSGVYFYRFVSEIAIDTKKMILIK